MKLRITSILTIALVFSLATGCRQKTRVNDLRSEKQYVKVISPSAVKYVQPIQATGMLATRTEVKLSFKTGGIVEKVNVREGQQVKRGTLLASLDLSEIDARVKQADIALEKALRDLKRAQNLFQDSVVTLETMQNAQSAFDVAKAEKQIAAFNRQHSAIYAPASGKIQKILPERNEIVGPGQPVILFATTENDWILRTSLPDKDIVRCKMNDSAVITMDAFPDTTFSGRISELGSFADPVTGTYEVELLLQQELAEFRTGFIGHCTIFPSDTISAYWTPLNAVIDIEGSQGYIFTVDDNIAYKNKVALGELRDDGILILKGVDSLQQIVTEGAGFLKNEEQVVIIGD